MKTKTTILAVLLAQFVYSSCVEKIKQEKDPDIIVAENYLQSTFPGIEIESIYMDSLYTPYVYTLFVPRKILNIEKEVNDLMMLAMNENAGITKRKEAIKSAMSYFSINNKELYDDIEHFQMALKVNFTKNDTVDFLNRWELRKAAVCNFKFNGTTYKEFPLFFENAENKIAHTRIEILEQLKAIERELKQEISLEKEAGDIRREFKLY